MRRRLRDAQIAEESTMDESTNEIKYTIDFLSLKNKDLLKFKRVYIKIDHDRDGFISIFLRDLWWRYLFKICKPMPNNLPRWFSPEYFLACKGRTRAKVRHIFIRAKVNRPIFTRAKVNRPVFTRAKVNRPIFTRAKVGCKRRVQRCY